MTLQQLHYIIEIAKNGSITAAAEPHKDWNSYLMRTV